MSAGHWQTVKELVTARGARSPEASALAAEGRAPMSYAALEAQVRLGVEALGRLGVGRGDRVALVLPDGPEMATAFVTVASAATCAPLNSRYRADELAFYLQDLGARALVVLSGFQTPAREVAAGRGIPVIELEPLTMEPAGSFRLVGAATAAPAGDGVPGPDDVALVLHTSGTTSRPKMVPLTHGNLLASAASIARALVLTPDDRCLGVMPLFHIHGLIGVLLSSLEAGASVYCTGGFDAPRFTGSLVRSQATWYSAVPTMHQAVLARAQADPDVVRGHHLRLIRSSSSALPPSVMAGLEATFGVPVIESYGMTEASHQMASNPLPPAARKPGSVGPAAGPDVAIMDEAGRLLLPGAKGEIVIRGASVTRGYEANPEANARAYTDGWFRTGDEGFLDADGYLFISGRIKEIINRGGEKIAPREIDEVLLAHPAVAQALTFAAPHPALGEEIAAAVVVRQGAHITAGQLQGFVAERLADFKVPRRIIFLDEIPKGPTGKLQRIGLAARLGVEFDIPASEPTRYVAPETPSQLRLAAIWEEVLALPRVGLGDDFFDLGGDSILITRVLARVQQEFGVELPFEVFFSTPTVEALAAAIDEALAVGGLAPADVITRVDRAAPLRPSFTQEGMWFEDELRLGLAMYNRPVAIALRGALNIGDLRTALCAVVARHEVLRARFSATNGIPALVIADEVEIPLPVTDLGGRGKEERDRALIELLRSDGREPFDLGAGPLLRARLLRLEECEHVLALVFHHTVFDGTSAGVLLRDLGACYDAAVDASPTRLPELPVQFADWAAWQRRRVEGGHGERDIGYWLQALEGSPHVLDLPTDHPRPAQWNDRGACHVWRLPALLREGLVTLARQEGVSLFTALLAGYAALLGRLAGQDEVLVGSPVSGRTRVEIEQLVGVFVNTLVLRADMRGNPSFRELLGRCRSMVEAALGHQELPFERLVEAIQPSRDLSRSPLFQAVFQLRNLHEARPTCRHLELKELPFDRGVAIADLALDAVDRGDDIECTLTYNAELFAETTAIGFARQLETLLAAVVADPDTAVAQVLLQSALDRELVPERWQGGPAQPGEDVCLHELLAAQAERTPDAVAVEWEGGQYSYAELHARANHLAHLLVARGAGVETVVGIAVPRSPEMVVAVLAVLKAGAAYLPLDPEQPKERLAFLLDDSRAVLVVTTESVAARLPADGPPRVVLERKEGSLANLVESPPASGVTPDNLAYVIHTSGSTGTPKGVMVEHRGVVSYARAVISRYEAAAGDRMRWRHDGRLEFVGRLDRQVEIRGHRVEPGEVEATLARHSGVRQTAVLARRSPDGETCLVAYLVPATGAELRVAEVRAFLAGSLPDFMVPARFVVVDELPVNLAGKVDTGALPLPEATASPDDSAPTPLGTPLQREVAAVWSAVLGLEAIGMHENFFAIGGHSLKVMQVVARLHQNLGLEVPVKVFFEAPTIAGLAEALETLLWLRDAQLAPAGEQAATGSAD